MLTEKLPEAKLALLAPVLERMQEVRASTGAWHRSPGR
jgi:hypothetical protein